MIPFLSNVTGTWIQDGEAVDPSYWARHLRQPARFADGVSELLRAPGRVLLEVGPGNLASLARRQATAAGVPVVSSTRRPGETGSDAGALACALGRLWTAGVRIDWRRVHGDERRRRIPLPTYPFERQRFWIDAVARLESLASLPPRAASLADCFHLPTWKRSTLHLVTSDERLAEGPWLILAEEPGSLGERLAARLEEAGAAVSVVRSGERPERLGESSWRIDSRRTESYETLLADLAERGRFPRRIVHLWSLETSGDDPRASLESSFFSLFHLAQALARGIADRRVELSVVTSGVFEVMGEEALHPLRATVLGVAKTLPQEASGVTCRVVDLEDPARLSADPGLADRLLGEAAGLPGETVVAYRGAHRWVQVFEPVHLDAVESGGRESRLREQGVYLITGGLGGLGLAVAGHLARTCRARLVLVGRSPLSPDGQEDPRAGRRLAKLRELESLGAEVLVASADVTDVRALRKVRSQAVARFGRIDGVFHTAGVAGGGLLQVRTREAAERVLAPKALGALALDEVFSPSEGPGLDFLVLFSSVAALISGPGQTDYAAANAFLDAFAHARNARHAFTVAIDWDAWQDVGMAVETGLPEELRRWREESLRDALPVSMGVEALDRVLMGSWPQVVVTRRPFQAWLEETRRARPAVEDLAGLAQGRPAHARPASLAGTYVAPRTGTERRIAEIWQGLLGVEPVGLQDSLFDLGGDSLVGIQLTAALRSAFGVSLPLREIFEVPRVLEMAARVEALLDLPRQARLADAIPRLRNRDALPLSFAQERLWFLDRLEPGTALYNIPGASLLTGVLDVAALERALGEILRRHEVLRTVFAAVDDRPVQRILPPAGLSLPVVDLSGLPAGEKERAVRRLAEAEARRPFDLARGPLARVLLARLGERDHACFFTLHHIAGDAGSLSVINREMAALYAAFAAGLPSPLPELPIQYADFAVWQRERLREETLGEAIAYWRGEARRRSRPARSADRPTASGGAEPSGKGRGYRARPLPGRGAAGARPPA